MQQIQCMRRRKFQSTLPIREETLNSLIPIVTVGISIHSSHTGRDYSGRLTGQPSRNFNPLFPYGKRPPDPACRDCPARISIHSSHTGRDAAGGLGESAARHFNPLFPYGKRPGFHCRPCRRRRNFNPLFPYGKRRYTRTLRGLVIEISIHSSHTGRDTCGCAQSATAGRYFNPLFPYGKRRRGILQRTGRRDISIHSSHTGRDTMPHTTYPTI